MRVGCRAQGHEPVHHKVRHQRESMAAGEIRRRAIHTRDVSSETHLGQRIDPILDEQLGPQARFRYHIQQYALFPSILPLPDLSEMSSHAIDIPFKARLDESGPCVPNLRLGKRPVTIGASLDQAISNLAPGGGVESRSVRADRGRVRARGLTTIHALYQIGASLGKSRSRAISGSGGG